MTDPGLNSDYFEVCIELICAEERHRKHRRGLQVVYIWTLSENTVSPDVNVSQIYRKTIEFRGEGREESIVLTIDECAKRATGGHIHYFAFNFIKFKTF